MRQFDFAFSNTFLCVIMFDESGWLHENSMVKKKDHPGPGTVRGE